MIPEILKKLPSYEEPGLIYGLFLGLILLLIVSIYIARYIWYRKTLKAKNEENAKLFGLVRRLIKQLTNTVKVK